MSAGKPPKCTGMMARVRDGKIVLDVRTVFAEQEPLLIEAIRAAAEKG